MSFERLLQPKALRRPWNRYETNWWLIVTRWSSVNTTWNAAYLSSSKLGIRSRTNLKRHNADSRKKRETLLKDMREILSNRTYVRNIVDDLVSTLGSHGN